MQTGNFVDFDVTDQTPPPCSLCFTARHPFSSSSLARSFEDHVFMHFLKSANLPNQQDEEAHTSFSGLLDPGGS